MVSVMRSVGPIKAEIRLQQSLDSFARDLKPKQRATFIEDRQKFCSRHPDGNDVAVFVSRLNDRVPMGHRYSPRFFNILQIAQQFAAIGEALGGVQGQGQLTGGVWSAIRITLLFVTESDREMDKLSRMFMIAGQSAPRYEAVAWLYNRNSKRLWSYYYEYFIVLVEICSQLVKYASQSPVSRIFAARVDDAIETFQSDLARWSSMIKQETLLLIAQGVEKQGSRLKSVLGNFGAETQRETRKAHARVLAACSEYDYRASWRRIRKLGRTALFSQTSDYASWKEDANTDGSSTLIFLGKLGCGKSVLMANVVEDLNLHVERSKAPVAYFFCLHDDRESLKASTIIGALARQLLEPAKDHFGTAELLGDRHRWCDLDEIISVVKHSLPAGSKAYFAVDGLDECDDFERRLLIDKLRELQGILALCICFSFRLEADNALRLDPKGFLNGVTVTIPENNPEIEQFVRNELERCIEADLLAVGDPTLVNDIANTLVSHAHGMFLWVALQLSSLCVAKTDQEIREALADIPEDLAETFSRVMHKCTPSGKRYQRRILELVVAAVRPLTTEELREALGVFPGDANWDPNRLTNNIYGALESCGALIMVDEETLSIRVVHQSAKDFLLGNFPARTADSRIVCDAASKNMSQTVVTYLNYGIFDTQLSTATSQSFVPANSTPSVVVQSTSTSGIIKDLALMLLRADRASTSNLDMTRLLENVRGRANLAARESPHLFILTQRHIGWSMSGTYQQKTQPRALF